MERLKLSEKVKGMLKDFVRDMKGIYKEDLKSIILYGSASSGEFADKHSNVNILVVLDDTSLGNLARAGRAIVSRKYRMLNILFFTPDYIKSSTDVFPLEFLDMKENHTVLYGNDALKEAEVDSSNLRFQCEQELKSKIINMKRLYLITDNKSHLQKLLFGSFSSCFHILRNLLRVKGINPSYSKEDALKEIQEALRTDMAIFYKILQAKKRDIPLSLKELDSLFIGFVNELDKIANIVDKI